jgi:predicted  nucleic acid-binding Zn-ribbon protein
MTDTKDLKALLQQELDRLSEVRDELRVQLSLAKADALEEWNKLEVNWGRVEEEIKRVASHTKEPVHNIGAAARQLLDELKQGYDRVRTQLKSSR